jgi:hypothetical protein
VAKIKVAPTRIPTTSKAAPVIWLDALLRIGGTLQIDYSKRQGEGLETVWTVSLSGKERWRLSPFDWSNFRS